MATEKFHYTLPDKYKLVLPKLENLPLGVARKTRKLEKADQFFTMLEMLVSDTALEHIDKLDQTQFGELMEAWEAASNVSAGESSASSSS